jgi:hypothetical protein
MQLPASLTEHPRSADQMTRRPAAVAVAVVVVVVVEWIEYCVESWTWLKL